MIKFLIVVCLIGIVLSLASGLFYLVNDKGESKKMGAAVRAAAVRVVAGADSAARHSLSEWR